VVGKGGDFPSHSRDSSAQRRSFDELEQIGVGWHQLPSRGGRPNRRKASAYPTHNSTKIAGIQSRRLRCDITRSIRRIWANSHPTKNTMNSGRRNLARRLVPIAATKTTPIHNPKIHPLVIWYLSANAKEKKPSAAANSAQITRRALSRIDFMRDFVSICRN
jgi:hypothetical protein